MSQWENSGTPAAQASRTPGLVPPLYDRGGQRIDFATYVQLHLDNPGCEYVTSERIGPYFVSTLWFGIDTGAAPTPGPRRPGSRRAPAVFRTLVERLEDTAPDPRVFGLTPDTLRYATEADARAGHLHVAETLLEVTYAATAERPAVRADA